MNDVANSDKSAGRGWLRNKIVPLSVLLLALAITVGMFLYREEIAGLKEYAYLGAFLISLLGNATIILPIPSPLILASLAAILYQDAGLIGIVGVGLAGGAGQPLERQLVIWWAIVAVALPREVGCMPGWWPG